MSIEHIERFGHAINAIRAIVTAAEEDHSLRCKLDKIFGDWQDLKVLLEPEP